MNDREREQIQDVLDYHNSKYGVQIKGRASEIYPQVSGYPVCDWLCGYADSGDEVAVIVKRLSGGTPEDTAEIVRFVLSELEDSLAGMLGGTFKLEVEMPGEYSFPRKSDRLQWNRIHEFRNLMASVIYDKAPTLRFEEKRDLTTQITGKLSYALPVKFRCRLEKTDYGGSAVIATTPDNSGFNAPLPGVSEAEEFERLVREANEQLREAGSKQKWLVVNTGADRVVEAKAVEEALAQMGAGDISQITRFYCLGGGEVTEISLPSLGRDS